MKKLIIALFLLFSSSVIAAGISTTMEIKCKSGYQFLVTIITTKDNGYGVQAISVSTVQIFEEYDGRSLPLKCR